MNRIVALSGVVGGCVLVACAGHDSTLIEPGASLDDASFVPDRAPPEAIASSGVAVRSDAPPSLSGVADAGTLDDGIEPSAALAPFERRCGSGALTALGHEMLTRPPYLQRLSSDSMELLFRLAPEATELGSVEVSTPDGVPVSSGEVAIDRGAPDGRQRVAHVEGLEPSSYYCYSLSGLTEPIGFRTAPRADEGAVVRFSVFGDSGSGGATQLAVRDQIAAVPFDLLLHTGDIAYEAGSLAQFESNFFGVYAGLLKSLPAFPVPGNHEYRTDSAGPFVEVFDLPDNHVPGAGERWYSFDWGDVHFVALDTERLGTLQIAWLEQDLTNNRRPWVVAFLHRPPYSSGEHGGASNVEAAFVPLFERHHVPIVFSGHDHDYERTLPINGVTYVVTGGGGKGTRDVGTSAFTARSESILHFVAAEIRDNSLHLRAIDEAGNEFDSVDITR
jgi:Calcineurin-like phosphoesterase